MTKTFSSARISSAMASRSASRTVVDCMSVPSGISGSGATAAVTGASAASDAATWTDCSAADAVGFSAVVADGASAIAVASSPSSNSTAIKSLTGTFSVPSATTSLPMRPSSTASSSIVALSVSISAIKSPERTSSPSFTNHLASVPSSMVGESAGIKISILMPAPPQ